jgi:hypothetical protein
MLTSEPKLLDAATAESVFDTYSPESLREILRALGFDEQAAQRAFMETVTQDAWDSYWLCLDVAHDPTGGRPRKPLPVPRTLAELAAAAAAFGRRAHGSLSNVTIDVEDKAFWTQVEQRTRGMDRRQREATYADLHRCIAGTADGLRPLPPPETFKTADEMAAEAAAALEASRRADAAVARHVARVQGRPDPVATGASS